MKLNRWRTQEEVLELYKDSNNPLVKIAIKYNTSKITDPETCHYCSFYDNHFRHIKNRKLKILEIGVKNGDSLLMWKEYFKNSLIFGLEYNPDPLLEFDHDRIKIFIGDQSDLSVLGHVTAEAGPFDIIIDDASHMMDHQQISFDYLFKNSLKDDGIYVIEDLATSYWEKWGGGLGADGSTIEFLKKLVDGVNYRFHKGNRTEYVGIPDGDTVDSSYFDEHIVGVSFYKALCFIHKGDNPKEIV